MLLRNIRVRTRLCFGPFALSAGFLLVLSAVAGCRGVAETQAERRPAPSDPLWNSSEFYRHLRVLNGSEVQGRATGTQGFARAAAYVADRMREFRLQPALEGEYRILYTTPMNYVQAAQIQPLSTDTLLLFPAIDYLPGALSDSGTVRISALTRIDPAEMLPPSQAQRWPGETAVLLDAAQAGAEVLENLSNAGARVVFIERELVPRLASAPVPDLLVVQVTPRTAGRLERYLQRGTGRAGNAPLLRIRVMAEHRLLAGALNVMGYLAGKHPVLASELVMVCADLDARAAAGDVRTVDLENLGTGAAALLELANRYGQFSQMLTVPDRTIMFAAFSGSLLDEAGLRAYLGRPLWALEATRAVIYLGLAPEREARVRSLLAAHGITLHAVPPAEERPDGSPVVLIQDVELRRAAVANNPRLPLDPTPDMSQLFDAAAVQAEHMAEAGNELLQAEAISPAPPVPVMRPDLPPVESTSR